MTGTFRFLAFVVLVVEVSFPSISFAQEDCGKLPTTGDQRVCAERQLEDAERAMRRSYDHALSMYTSDPKQQKGLEKDDLDWYRRVREKLILSQRNWVAYRKSSCAVIAEQYYGGTIVSVAVPLCQKELAEQRTKWLDTFAADAQPANSP